MTGAGGRTTERFREALPGRVAETGTRDPERALSLVTGLLDLLPWDDGGWEPALSAARTAPDPALFLLNLSHLADALPEGELAAAFANRSVLPFLSGFLGGSAFFPVQLVRRPELFRLLFVEGETARPADGEGLLAEAEGGVLACATEEEAKALLRRIKLREMSRIAARDLAGAATLAETTGALSDLASAALSASVRFGRRVLDGRFGRAMGEFDGGEREARFVVMGMGKLGARELNFSSDVDLIYFYETDRGGTDGGSEGKPLSLHQYFVRLSEVVTRLVSEVTDDGFVFRTDLRLRPEGNKGDLALSLRSAEIYYEAYGQTWERSAMIKARPVAGDRELGDEFLALVAPFVYRKYMDFIAVEEIKEMKERVNEEVARRRLSGKDIKLGHGGIREIEFFVQAHQLIYGGKVPSLRTRGTLETLAELSSLGMVTAEERKGLEGAYDFLRRLEHRIQAFGERQTHVLPGREEDLFRLARAMGFPGKEELGAALSREEGIVKGCFGRLFGGARAKEETPERVLPLLDPEAGEEELAARLAAAGFPEPAESLRHLHTLREGPSHVRLTARARGYLRKLAPVLLDRILDTPDPAMALGHVDRFLASIGQRTLFYALLHENRKVVELLVRLFGSSPFLSGYLLRHPDLLDTFLRNDLSVPMKSKSDFRRDLGEAMAKCSDFEQELEELRRFKHLEELRIGIHEMGGNLALEEATFQLAALAEAILSFAYGLSRREVSRRHGVPLLADGTGREAAFCVLALGKLGAEELSYHSDLDIIFLYEGAGETGSPDGNDAGLRHVSNHEYFAKLAQRLISVLTTATREGAAYHLDTRLRPSGNAGPLVSSFAAFETYHDRAAALWERQALLKGRFVAGDREFGRKVEEQVRHVLYDHPLPEGTAVEIHRLRTRMEVEIGKEGSERWNLKVGRGGVVDVEFAVQYLQLVHGGAHPSVRARSTLKGLYELRRAGLLPEEGYEALAEGYRFLRSMEVRLRLLHDASIDSFDPSMVDAETLARYREETGKIRRVYLEILGIPAAADGEGGGG